jgi:hypothetical protein
LHPFPDQLLRPSSNLGFNMTLSSPAPTGPVVVAFLRKTKERKCQKLTNMSMRGRWSISSKYREMLPSIDHACMHCIQAQYKGVQA